MKKILILEDETSIREFIVYNFKKAGYEIFETAYGREAIEIFNQNTDINLAILDVTLADSDIDGFEVCRKLREKNRQMGILMVSAKDLDDDILSGFISGADDYIKKPVSLKVLLAKVDALYRRISQNENIYTSDQRNDSSSEQNITLSMKKFANTPFTIDEKRQIAMKNDQILDLTPNEYLLLKFFLEHPDIPLMREEILQAVWGYDFNGDGDIVNVNIRRLRIKIEDDASKPVFIKTEWGQGYRWKTQ